MPITSFQQPISMTKARPKSVNPFTDNKILDWSKLKQSADDNFEFDVNS